MKNGKRFTILQNNKGITLIELIIAMAVTTIVIGMTVMIISAGSHNYRLAQNEINLQSQSQASVNQIEDLVIEASWLEKKTNVLNAGTTDVSSEVTAYIIYSGSGISALVYDRTRQMLFYLDGLSVTQVSSLTTASYTKEANLMASYVSEFTIDSDSSNLLTNQETRVQITFQKDTSELKVDKTIAFRNHAAPTTAPKAG